MNGIKSYSLLEKYVPGKSFDCWWIWVEAIVVAAAIAAAAPPV